jgi:outer membrane protein OmpA-like peptidoglycan-associated protein
VKRAKEVRDFLEKNGVKKGFIKVAGMGEKEPIATNKTEAGRAKNRRCEFIIR